MHAVVSGQTAVAQMEVCWAIALVAGWVWLRKRRQLQSAARGQESGVAMKNMAYAPLSAVDVA
jgi:hypothetical protein